VVIASLHRFQHSQPRAEQKSSQSRDAGTQTD
jgi:hypothetical protein